MPGGTRQSYHVGGYVEACLEFWFPDVWLRPEIVGSSTVGNAVLVPQARQGHAATDLCADPFKVWLL